MRLVVSNRNKLRNWIRPLFEKLDPTPFPFCEQLREKKATPEEVALTLELYVSVNPALSLTYRTNAFPSFQRV